MTTDLLPTTEEVHIAKQEKEQERISIGLCPKCIATIIETDGRKKCTSCEWIEANTYKPNNTETQQHEHDRVVHL